MRILIDSDNSACGNLGDVAMLQVCVGRLRRRWPGATIECLTDMPERLTTFCPGVVPVSATGRYTWLANEYLVGPLHRVLPEGWSAAAGGAKRYLGRIHPRLLEKLIATKAQWRRLPACDARPFRAAMQRADLVVVSGIGALTDSARLQSHLILETLRMAHVLGRPTAMLGQGIGPLTDRSLEQVARDVLPDVGLIAVREGRRAPSHLRSWGVSRHRILVTGDDAIELAYAERPAALGCGIGVNARRAPYAGVDDRLVDVLRQPLLTVARRMGGALVPLPIKLHRSAPDSASIRMLLGEDEGADGGAACDTPLGVVAAAGRCRCVVTVAYHAAVFALSQGIPAVCLVASDYYRDKFEGLAELFGGGCVLVELGGPGAGRAVQEAIEHLWREAPHLRAALLKAAAAQIAAGQAAVAAVANIHRASPAADGSDAPMELAR